MLIFFWTFVIVQFDNITNIPFLFLVKINYLQIWLISQINRDRKIISNFFF